MRWAIVPWVAVWSIGCSDMFGTKDVRLPGEAVGVYKLSAEVDDTSTCAEIIAATPRPWSFEVSLRREGSTAIWMSGPEPITGPLDPNKGSFSFSTAQRIAVRPADKAKELGACAIIRRDSFNGSLAGPVTTAAGVASFTGTLRFSYSIESGSDCRDVVGPVTAERKTPLFSTMPCEARYAVTATKIGESKSK